MASFTDNSQALSNFTPYVEQFPIEAAVQVGMEKQRRYDEGYQRIQTYVENVAGLDVARDVDKQYLQSKLNQLQGDLRTVAASDFSQYQLVNSVGGMIGRVGKDKNVQNAVLSTAKFRKGLAEMETARKEGKSSPSNEFVFNRSIEGWLNDPNPGTSFDGVYKPYTNWKKNGLEVLKALTKDETITDDAFTIDSNGRIVIADAMVRKKLAGISPDKVQQALLVGLTPGDFQQMEIDGVYSYANLNTEQFIKGATAGRTESLAFYNDQKKVLENAKASTTSVSEKTKLNDQIKSLNKAISDVDQEYNTISQATYSNLDAAKAQYFTRNAIDGFARAFSYTETSQTLLDSPLAEAQRWREGQNLEWKKFMLKYEQDERGLALKERDTKAKEKEVSGYGGLPIGVKQEDLPRYTLNKVIGEINSSKQAIENLDENFATSQGKDQMWIDQQKVAWEQSPSSVSPIVADHFNLTEKIRRESSADATMVMDIEKEAVDKFGDVYQHIPKDSKSIRYRNNGVEYTYSPKDFVDFNSEMQNYVGTSFTGGTGGGNINVSFDLNKAKQELSPKKYHLLEVMQGKNLGSTDKTLLQHIQHYNRVVNVPYKDTVDKINKYTADEVSKRISTTQGVSFGVPTGNAEQKSSIGTVLTQFADLADSQKGGLPNSPNFDSETARKLASETSPKYSLTVVGGTQRQPTMYELNASGESGSISMRITPEQKNSVFGNMFEESPEVLMAQPYLEQMNKMGGYSTALASGESNHNNAFLSKIDFPSVRTYGIKANVVTLMPGSNRYTIKLSVFDPVKKTWYDDIDYPSSGMIPVNAIAPALMKLNDSAIYEIINGKPATVNDLKTIDSASKKPL